MKCKYRAAKPTRTQLNGMSCSEFKTALKRIGYNVPRDFFKNGSVARLGNRLYRFRWWSEQQLCDVSCVKEQFDRWANSVDHLIPITQMMAGWRIKNANT